MSLQAAIFVGLTRVCILPESLSDEATCHTLKGLTHKPDRFGLKRIGVDFSQFPDVPKDLYAKHNDIYYTPELGDGLITFIECAAEEVGPTVYGLKYVPHCYHNFVFEPLNASVKVHYRRVYLGSWRNIQASVEQLLQSFIADDANSNNKKRME